MNFYNQQLINDKEIRIMRGIRLFWETLGMKIGFQLFRDSFFNQ